MDRQNRIAADDYFDRFFQGTFRPGYLGVAHEWCRDCVLKRLLSNNVNVVCHNTNITYEEINEHIFPIIFSNHRLCHKIVFAIMPQQNIKILAKRNLHGNIVFFFVLFIL